MQAVGFTSAAAGPCVAFSEDKFGVLCRNLKLATPPALKDQIMQPVQLMQVCVCVCICMLGCARSCALLARVRRSLGVFTAVWCPVPVAARD